MDRHGKVADRKAYRSQLGWQISKKGGQTNRDKEGRQVNRIRGWWTARLTDTKKTGRLSETNKDRQTSER